MFIVLIWYSVILVGLALLFMIARVHSYKFKNYSRVVWPITRWLAVLFIILWIIWYISIFIGMISWEPWEIINTGEENNTVDEDFDIIY